MSSRISSSDLIAGPVATRLAALPEAFGIEGATASFEELTGALGERASRAYMSTDAMSIMPSYDP